MIKLGARDITFIYERFVKPYHNKLGMYEDFESFLYLNDKEWKWEDKDFPRIISLLDFRRLVQTYGIESKKAASFNGPGDPEWEYFSHEVALDYKYNKETGANDLHSWNPEEHSFDFVMANQTLEHVYDPILCLQNVYRHMAKDGLLYLNVPVLNIQHETPIHHYMGYTPTGLGCVCYSAGFEPVEIGFWGNKEYIDFLFAEGWVDYRRMSMPLVNDPKFATIAWILAKRM
jgi:SAM-dependent methyltransferase